MNLKFGFAWMGLVVFVLPMIINIVYAIFPPAEGTASAPTNKMLEMIEQATRILYLIAMVFLVSKDKLNYRSPWMFIGLLFLVLYYIVWIRYFVGGREISLMSKSFLYIPIPLAVFPVLYFLCAAIWMHNIPAVVFMVIFGVVHNFISHMSFV